MKNRQFFLLIISILFASIFIGNMAQASSPTNISGMINLPTTWTRSGSPYLIHGYVNVNAPLTIEPGVVIKFDYHRSATLQVYSNLIAKGTESEPIIFTSVRDDSYGGDTNDDAATTIPKPGDWVNIEFKPNSHSELDHVNVSYGSSEGVVNGEVSTMSDNVTIHNSTIRFGGYCGLFLYNSQPTIEGNTISNNGIGVFVQGNKLPKITNNSIFDNMVGALAMTDASKTPKLDARGNWWGDPSGPYFKHVNYGVDNLSGKGNPVQDGIIFDSWFVDDPAFFRKPIIFVPGIGASINPDLMISGILADNWKMFDHTYDGIIQSFKAMGYVENKNLFIAYYDWRKSNTESAQNFLKPTIQKALLLNPGSKVNVVTHSMGSLVARSYVQSDAFANDVDNLIMIAPPNRGSSDVYTAWEGGYIPKNWEGGWMMRAYLNYLKIKNSEFNSVDVVHRYIPSLKDLMPVYDFVHPAGEVQNLKSYLSMNEKNDFLLNLNSGIGKLNQRTRFSIILGDKQPTVSKIPVISAESGSVWVDGKPDPIDPLKNDTSGDGEVLVSSGDVTSAFRDVLNFGHREIVTQSQQIVANRLNDDFDKIHESPVIKDEMYFWSDAPADMTIVSPDEKTVSKNGNGIENSNFAQETKKDGFKIASVPNPKKGSYKVKLVGNSDGKAHIGVEYGSHVGNNDEESFVAEVNVSRDDAVEYDVVVDPENIQKPISELVQMDIVAPKIEVSSPQNGFEYFNDQILPIAFLVSDDVSKNEKIKTEMYLDGQLVDFKEIDLARQFAGEHDLKIVAIDEAGNHALKNIFFTVKKAMPSAVPDPVIPPVIEPEPIIAPVIVLPEPVSSPAVSPDPANTPAATMLETSTPNPIFQNLQSTSSRESSHHKSSRHSHRKKSKIKEVAGKIGKVLGISTIKNYYPVRAWNLVAKNTNSFWKQASKRATEFQGYIFGQKKIFGK